MRRSPPTTIGSRALKAELSFSARLHVGAVVAVEQFEIAVDGIRDAGWPRWPAHRRCWRSAGSPWRSWPRSARARRRRSRATSRSLPAAPCSAGSISASSRRKPPSSRIRTMAWPPMARPIASMARPFEVDEIEQKAFAGLAQRVDRVVHLQRRFRRQPGSEGEHALRRFAGSCDISSEVSPVICGRLSPAAHEIRICGSANSSARKRSVWACNSAISVRSRASVGRRGRACASGGSPPPRRSRAAPAPWSVPRLPGD